ncbi:tetratricopeptide repeat protein [Rubrolithibacter danxiaensis]|uniref:tetratricopeptide repeat protein n=1 Tax=Rubrolithibacter danxiaensis TaxID=3390805 RepID=UPI003BF8B0B3
MLTASDSAVIKNYFFEGLKAKSIQNFQLAGEYFRRVIEIDPGNGASLFELGNLYHNQNDESEAEHFAREAVTVDSDNEWYWLLLADIYKKTGNWPSLELVFTDLIRIDPQKTAYYFDKANVLLLQNKVNDAAKLYEIVEKRFGYSQELSSLKQRVFLKQGKTDKVIEEIEHQIKSNPADIRNYLLLSDLYLDAKKPANALTILQQAKSLDPDNPFTRISLADVYRNLGREAEASAELKDAFGNPALSIDTKVKIVLSYFPQFSNPARRNEAEELAVLIVKAHPGDPKAFSLYGDVLFQQNKLSEARNAYKNALKLNNQVYLIWEQLIRIEINLGEVDSVIKDGEEALSLFPNQAQLYLLTGLGYLQKNEFEIAITHLKNAEKLETENKEALAQIYSSLGDAYSGLKRNEESDQAYEKALQIDEDNAYALNNYAYYLSLRGSNLDKAEKMSLRSNELDPGNASFEDTYAWILFKQKKYKEAKLWIEKAINNDKKGSAVKLEHYGDILFHNGEQGKALEQWKKARDKGLKSKQLEKKINEKNYSE